MKFFVEVTAFYYRSGKAGTTHQETFVIDVDVNIDGRVDDTIPNAVLAHVKEDENLSSALDFDSAFMLRVRILHDAHKPPMIVGE